VQPSKIRFAAFGDTGVFNTSRALFRRVTELRDSLDLVLHVGDFGYNKQKGKWGIQYEEYASQKQDTWDEWFTLVEPIANKVPYMVCPGNHETGRFDFNYIPYSNRFAMPGDNDFFYSFDYGPIHFVSLSTDHEFDPLSDQVKWLDEDLAKVERKEGEMKKRSKPPSSPFCSLSSLNQPCFPFSFIHPFNTFVSKGTWIIVYLHRPMYSSSPEDGSNLPLRAAVEPILVKHKVDLTICGHDHSYERTYPVSGGVREGASEGMQAAEFSHLGSSSSEPNPNLVNRFQDPSLPIHLRVGTGGIDMTAAFEPWPAWSAFRSGRCNLSFLFLQLMTASFCLPPLTSFSLSQSQSEFLFFLSSFLLLVASFPSFFLTLSHFSLSGLYHGFLMVELDSKVNTLRVEFVSTEEGSTGVKDIFEIKKSNTASLSIVVWMAILVVVLAVVVVVATQRRQSSLPSNRFVFRV
jgi:hypothetical protein